MQARIEPVVHLVDGVGEQRETTKAEILALHRDHHGIRAGQRVHGQQPQRGLAVDEDEVVPVEHRMQRAAECLLASHLGDELDLCGREIDVAGQQVEAVDAGTHEDVVGGGLRRDQQVVDRLVEFVVRDAQTGRQRTLRIEIDEQHASPVLGECGAQIDRRRRLADAALLIADGDDLRRAVPVQWAGIRDVAVWAAGGAEFLAVTGPRTGMRLAAGIVMIGSLRLGDLETVLMAGCGCRVGLCVTRCGHVPGTPFDPRIPVVAEVSVCRRPRAELPEISIQPSGSRRRTVGAPPKRSPLIGAALIGRADGPSRTPHASCSP